MWGAEKPTCAWQYTGLCALASRVLSLNGVSTLANVTLKPKKTYCESQSRENECSESSHQGQLDVDAEVAQVAERLRRVFAFVPRVKRRSPEEDEERLAYVSLPLSRRNTIS